MMGDTGFENLLELGRRNAHTIEGGKSRPMNDLA
jgi:hypothetical protein